MFDSHLLDNTVMYIVDAFDVPFFTLCIWIEKLYWLSVQSENLDTGGQGDDAGCATVFLQQSLLSKVVSSVENPQLLLSRDT